MRSLNARKLIVATAAACALPYVAYGQQATVNGFFIEEPTYKAPPGYIKPSLNLPDVRFPSGPEASGTWVGGDDNYGLDACGVATAYFGAGSWHTSSNWSGGTVPNGASDIATINEPADGIGDIAINLNSSVTLAGINLGNDRGTDIFDFNSAGSVINTGTGGLKINSGDFFPESDKRFKESFATIYFGQRIQVPINGSGSVEITGDYPVWLTAAANNFSGGLVVRNGYVTVADFTSTTVDALPPGPANESQWGTGTITLDGGTLRVYSNLPTPTVVNISAGRNIVLGAGGGTLSSTTSLGNVDATISGNGDLNSARGGAALLLRGSNTYTGATNVRSGSMTVGGTGGQLLNTSAVNVRGTFTIANGSTAGLDRVNDAAAINLKGGVFRVSSNVNYNETVGPLSIDDGVSSVAVISPAAGTGDTAVTFGNLTRLNKAVLAVAGRNLGMAAGGTLTTHVFINNGTSLLAGSGTGATDKPIIPFAYGATANSNTIGTGGGTGSFVTYDAQGVRPLDLTTEYVQNALGTAQDNVRMTAPGALNGAAGALLIGSPTNVATNPAGTVTGSLTLSKGLLLNTAQGNAFDGTLTTSASELVIISASDNSATAGLTLLGNITGNFDVTKSGPGTVFMSGNNTYTGKTVLGQGRTYITSNVPATGPGPFGNPAAGNEAIVLRAGGANLTGAAATYNTRLLNDTGSLSIGRPLVIDGEGPSGVLIGSFTLTTLTRYDGTVTVGDKARLIVQGNVEFRNNISGSGFINDNAGHTLAQPVGMLITGNNSGYTGAWQTGVYQYRFNGATNPLGLGTVFANGSTEFVSQTNTTMGNNWTVLGFGLGNYTGPGKTTLTGNVDLGSFTSQIRVGNGTTSGSAGTVEIAGNMSKGNLLFQGVPIGSSTTDFSTGTLVLSGNNTGMTAAVSVFLGTSAVVADATCSVAASPEIPGGVLQVTNSNALGNGDVFIRAENSTLQLNGGVGAFEADLNIGDLVDYFIQGDGVGTGGSALGAINNLAGNNTIAGDIVLVEHNNELGTLNFSQTIRVESGSSLNHTGVIFDGSVGSSTGVSLSTLVKTGGGQLGVTRVIATDVVNTGTTDLRAYLGGLDIQAGTVKVANSPTNNEPDSLSAVKSLNVAAGAKLDLGNNSLVVEYTGVSPRAAIEALIDSAHNGGAWNGNGITSSSANSSSFALGVAEITDTTLSGSYLGLPVDTTAVLVRFTRYGDVNLDGTANIGDFAVLAANFNTAGRWATGDVNYDGSVSIGDFSLLAANFNLSAGDGMARSAVPEPASLSLLALAGMGLARRRRA